jgi:allantoinase
MPDFDLIIRGAQPYPAIGIVEGKFAAFSDGTARETIDASGLLVLPGVVDAHVHFNEPGRTDWEGWETGSRAALAGGVTTVCDMPLNSNPPTVTVEAFDAKRRAAEAKSACDFALWGGLIPGFLNDFESLAARGVIGFKAFMSFSGISDFPKADLVTLLAGMRRAAAVGRPVAVHAEFDRKPPRPGTSVRHYLDSRPIESECEAIRAALDLAGETGCALHVVHVSSAAGIALITEARARGQDVTGEVCPHHLVLTDEDMERLGASAKCAPPLRSPAERDELWARVLAGEIQTIGSDHSPSPWSLKTDPDFFKVWGGISGIQHLLPVLLDAGLDPEVCARLTALHPARRFHLAGKGELTVGADADLTLVEIGGAHEVVAEALLYRHQHSPYVGRKLRARVRRTILRGQNVCVDGKVTAVTRGKLLVPT